LEFFLLLTTSPCSRPDFLEFPSTRSNSSNFFRPPPPFPSDDCLGWLVLQFFIRFPGLFLFLDSNASESNTSSLRAVPLVNVRNFFPLWLGDTFVYPISHFHCFCAVLYRLCFTFHPPLIFFFFHTPGSLFLRLIVVTAASMMSYFSGAQIFFFVSVKTVSRYANFHLFSPLLDLDSSRALLDWPAFLPYCTSFSVMMKLGSVQSSHCFGP